MQTWAEWSRLAFSPDGSDTARGIPDQELAHAIASTGDLMDAAELLTDTHGRIVAREDIASRVEASPALQRLLEAARRSSMERTLIKAIQRAAETPRPGGAQPRASGRASLRGSVPGRPPMSAPTGAGAYQMPVALRPYPHSQADASGHRSQALIGNPEEHTQMRARLTPSTRARATWPTSRGEQPRHNMTDTISEEQIVAALTVQATAAGAAAFLSRWHERTISAEWVMARVAASPRLQLVAKFSAEAHGRGGVMDLDRLRVMAGPRRWRDRRCRR